MSYVQKTWEDRVSEYPTRRVLTKEDGSTELVDVARAEGNITKEGDPFSAENMNDLEQRIQTGFDNAVSTVSKSLVEIGLEGYTTVNASVHMVKLSKNIANITINYKIVSNTKASDKYVFIDMEKIKSALGITSLEFSPTGTMVVFQPIVSYSGGTMAELTSYANEDYRGYTGLLLNNDGGLARVHNDSGTISPWPLNASMYTPTTLGTIIINGALIA